MIAASTAGGAQVDQLVALGAVYFGGTGAVIWLAHAHRAGRTQVLAKAGAVAAWALRVPAWAALPVVIATVGLLAAMWGGLWDIGYHVDNGRDTGPLGNPGHWPLLLGIFTTFAAGILAFAHGRPGGRDRRVGAHHRRAGACRSAPSCSWSA